MTTELFRFKIGDFECGTISDGAREQAITAIFESVPENELFTALDEIGYPARSVPGGYNVLYVDTGDQKILIDAGLGTGPLIENMQAGGIGPEEIDLIVITHGDGDHIGGILNASGEPNFPNARYALWKRAWELWTHEEERAEMIEEFIKIFRTRKDVTEEALAQAAERRANYGTVTLPAIKGRIDLHELGDEMLPGIKLIDAVGHRSDHCGVSIRSRGEHLLHVADSIKHPVQSLYPNWCGFIDSHPDIIAETNVKLFDLIAKTDATFFCTHLNFPALAKLDANGHMILIES